jgi:hypothetical protein
MGQWNFQLTSLAKAPHRFENGTVKAAVQAVIALANDRPSLTVCGSNVI